jgi:hypothetical protein
MLAGVNGLDTASSKDGRMPLPAPNYRAQQKASALSPTLKNSL